MAALDDLAQQYSSLASEIDAVDVDTVSGATSDVADQFAALGHSDGQQALAAAADNAGKIREHLQAASALAAETATALSGLT
jgi:hypothetical protein